MTRPDQLIADVASHFEIKSVPMNEQWIETRRVSCAEMEGTAEVCAAILKGYLALAPHERVKLLAKGAWLEAT